MSYSYPARRVVQVSAPAVEPVTLSEAKSFLRIDGTAEDALIGDMISAARIAAEEQTGRSLITQSWRLMYDGCVSSILELPHGPVQSVSSVKTVAHDTSEVTVSSDNYYLNAVQELVFDSAPSGHQIHITYVAGFGDEASDVPADIVQGVLLHVAHLYEHRDSLMPPITSQMYYANYRGIRL